MMAAKTSCVRVRAILEAEGLTVLALEGPRIQCVAGANRARSPARICVEQVLIDTEAEKIIGATLLYIEADESILSLLDVMYDNALYCVISQVMHIHPAVSGLIPTLLENSGALA